jgi:serine/threonine protein phosphatase PrpC
MPSMKIAGKSDKGKLRNRNEDAFFIHKKPLIAMVSDGMGGAPHGEIASELTIKTFSAKLLALETWNHDNIAQLVHETNDVIVLNASQNQTYVGMGATLSAYISHLDQTYIVNVGDSRVYGLKNNQLTLLTDDHTMMNEIMKQSDDTNAKIDQRYKHMLTSVIGIPSGCIVDITTINDNYDKILVCSDGLSNLVCETTMIDVLLSSQSIEDQVSELIDIANRAGGNDNITLIIIDTRGEAYE